ncbi:hypothetical protein GCM10022251_54500 [Phytohabitans flavus]|uniref:N-acetyltransferase domain-containing protein n=1 Tax=Phytohabitans flavus TaxID=1076124 RepID=A0A6F8XMB2_9ACTN|nr:GNAT family protein [Phytohabitans flavus]BCB74947.1 hypothetical protein Pflav_013570 [Phytohabitans flavus]
MRLVAEWAFDELGITGLAIEADAANTASIRVAEKCDFQRIGSRVGTDVDRGMVTTIVFAGRGRDQTVVIRSSRGGPHQARQLISVD